MTVASDADEPAKCICDGAKFDPHQEHPFLMNPACPVHGEPATPGREALREQAVQAALRALVLSPKVPTGMRADLSTLLNPDSGTLMIREAVDAQPVVEAVLDAVLAVLPSRETVAPTEEQIARALWDHWWRDDINVGNRRWDDPEWGGLRALRTEQARAVLAMFPGKSREAVEAAQRERDARIVEEHGGGYWASAAAAAIREADRG